MTTNTPRSLHRLRHNVASLENAETSGSAFLLRRSAESAILVTNYHLLPPDPSTEFSITLRNESGKDIEGKNIRVLWFDRLTDFALLAVDLPRHHGLPKGLVSSGHVAPRIGEEVHAIGNPAHLRQIVTRGIVSGRYHDGDAPQLLIDMHIHPGNSGGPLLDSRGRLVGLVSAGFAKGFEGLNLAIPIEYLFERVDPLREMLLEDPGARPLPHCYEAPHTLEPALLSDAELVDRVKDHAQSACGLDLHRRYQLAHFQRHPGRAPAESRLAVVFENRDSSDHVAVVVAGERYERIEHVAGAWQPGPGSQRVARTHRASRSANRKSA